LSIRETIATKNVHSINRRVTFSNKQDSFVCMLNTYKIRNWRNVLKSSLRIIDKLLNCNSL